MEHALERLVQKINDNYVEWWNKSHPDGLTDNVHQMIQEFQDNIEIRYGKKYIKIIKQGSVWGFIVNTHDDKKFKYGDILKAATFNAPAKNKPRGNIFDEHYSVHWTGPHYL